MTIVSTAVLLFLVMDPLGNVPLFVVALRDVEPRRHAWIVLREMVIALAVMVLFLMLGRHVLELFHISMPSLGMAGGIILFLIAIRMIFPTGGPLFGETPGGEPFIVPLAIPLVAGPSALVTLMIISTRDPGGWPRHLAALLASWLVSLAILVSSAPLKRLLGQRVLIATERLLGMILTAVAVQMFENGFRQAWTAAG